ncbi:nuclear transport factor 2 family protein [Listeria fleischmannii]|uniref:SnoaL-like domain-containing protein n=1 Tax=Listeria fleischmannii FSL S10-1203 TaxID=1265822 RepID=W7DQ18_9LIST|nr:nuclear transport factor 2 family protein [Listeria fleischmannii]EUJ51855.1 hypothetical protein MCOL2_14608 [Listeria fleischmannii FSL S10-1203]
MGNPLTIEEKRAIPHQFHTNLNNRDFERQYDLITSDIKFYKNGEVIEGADSFVESNRGMTKVFGGVHVTDKEIYADRNVAISRFVLSGYLIGEITFPDGTTANATNKPFSYNAVEFFSINEEGKVYEIRQVNDSGLTPTTIESQVK